MEAPSRSGKEVDAARSRNDAGENDRFIANLKAHIAALEKELQSWRDGLHTPGIVDSKRAEEALQASEAKYRDLVENANSIILRWDLEGNLTFFNEFAESFFGYPASEVLGRSVVGTIVPEAESTGRDLAAVFRDITQNPEHYKANVNENVRRNGERVWVSWTNKAIRDAQGNVVGVLSVGNDITERKRAEDALRASEARYRTLIENSPLGIFTCDLEGNTTSINPGILEIMGSDSPEFNLSVNLLAFEPAIKSGLADALRDCIMNGENRVVENNYTSCPGKSVCMRVHLTPLRDDEGEIFSILGVVEDVTGRRRTEEALREREEWLRRACRAGRIGLYEWKCDRGLLYFSPEACKLYDCEPGSVMAYEKWLPRVHPDDREMVERRFAKNQENARRKPGFTSQIEYRVVHGDGAVLWLEVQSTYNVEGGNLIVRGSVRDITERKRTEGALRKSEASLARSQAIARLASWELDVGTRELRHSDEYCRIFNLEPDASIEAFVEKLHPDDRARVLESVNAAIYGEKPYSIDYMIVPRPGEVLYIHAEAEMTYDRAGRPLTIFGTVQDITERKLSEEALRVSEERLRRMSRAGRIGLYELNVNRDLIYFSPEMYELYGYEPGSKVTCEKWLPRTHPEDLDTVERRFTEDCESGRSKPDFSAPIEYRVVHDDGTVLWLEALSTFTVEGGDLIVRGAARDITERKRAEEALWASEARYRTLIDNSPLGIFTCDLQGNTTSINPKILEIMGSEFQEFTMPVNLFNFEPMIKSGLADLLRDCIINGEDRVDEGSYTSYRGKSVYMRLHLAPLRDNTGQIYGILGVTEDVTERKLAEEALRESEEKFRALADTSHGFIAVHRGSKILYVNKQATKISGYSKDELLNMNFWEIFPPDLWEVIKERAFARLAGKPVPTNYEARVVTREGKTKWVDITAGLFTYEGKPAVILTLFDITNRVDAEEALKEEYARAELYLDLMGHDINNKNQIAMGFLEFLVSDESLDRELQGVSLSALRAVSDSSQIIANVRKLHGGRSGDYKSGVFDLGALIEEVAGQYRSVPDKNVNVSLETVEGVRVQADELLKDVFANLIGNAIKHSDRDAFISIGMVSERRDDRQYCLVTVEDHGPGVADVAKDRVFNRMQRGDTRATGSGLGLYLVKSLVNGYGGSVWVEDRVKGDHTKGAKFVVMLPAIDV